MKRIILTACFPVLLVAVLSACSSAPAATELSPTPAVSSLTASPRPSTATPTPTPTPAGLTYLLNCTAGGAARTKVTDYKAAWATPFDLCTVGSSAGTPSAVEKTAGAASGGKSADTAKFLYALCATSVGHYFEGKVSQGQATEIQAALTLCPDHPKRAQLEASAGSGVARDADQANGKLVFRGKYLVGKDVQPGVWQSQGDKVEDCYWEISDAQGNIIANNFVSVAPQFTITIPATAAGFTVRGCGFRWISG